MIFQHSCIILQKKKGRNLITTHIQSDKGVDSTGWEQHFEIYSMGNLSFKTIEVAVTMMNV